MRQQGTTRDARTAVTGVTHRRLRRDGLFCYALERMDFANIHLEKRPPLAAITLDRPKVLNALNRQTLEELDLAFGELAGDAAIRVILLTGAGGRAFAAGADIQELAGLTASEGTCVCAAGAGCAAGHRDAGQAGDRLRAGVCTGRRGASWRWPARCGWPPTMRG